MSTPSPDQEGRKAPTTSSIREDGSAVFAGLDHVGQAREYGQEVRQGPWRRKLPDQDELPYDGLGVFRGLLFAAPPTLLLWAGICALWRWLA